MKELLIAGLAALSVLVTSGYAFGAVRRRRALKELLEIRAAFEPDDGASREKVSALISSELSALEGLGNTTMRWRLAAATAVFSLVAVAAIALFSAVFFTGQQARDIAHYVAAGAFFVAGLAGFGLASSVATSVSGRRGYVLSSVGPLAVLIFAAFASTLSLIGTPYFVELTSG